MVRHGTRSILPRVAEFGVGAVLVLVSYRGFLKRPDVPESIGVLMSSYVGICGLVLVMCGLAEWNARTHLERLGDKDLLMRFLIEERDPYPVTLRHRIVGIAVATFIAVIHVSLRWLLSVWYGSGFHGEVIIGVVDLAGPVISGTFLYFALTGNWRSLLRQ